MQDFLVILQPNTYMKKKQPQLLLVSRISYSRHERSKMAACSRIPLRRRGHLAVSTNRSWVVAKYPRDNVVTPNIPTHVLRFFSLASRRNICFYYQ